MRTKTEEMIRLQPDWLARVPPTGAFHLDVSSSRAAAPRSTRRRPAAEAYETEQLLHGFLAAARGARPDLIRRDDERWARAAAAHE